jgi:hypothetical protein
MHKCAFDCCQDTKMSAAQVQRCVTQCQGGIEKASGVVESEMKQFSVSACMCG